MFLQLLLGSVADIDVEPELKNQVDRSANRAMPYLEGGKSTLRLTGASSPYSTNLSDESTRLDCAPPLLAGLPVPLGIPGFAPRDRTTSSQSNSEMWRSQQTQLQSQAPLPKNSENSRLQWDMTVPLPNVEGSNAACPSSVPWQSHSKQLG